MNEANMLQYINLGVAIFAMICLGAFIYWVLWPSIQKQNDAMTQFLMTELKESKAARTEEFKRFAEISENQNREFKRVGNLLEVLSREIRKNREE